MNSAQNPTYDAALAAQKAAAAAAPPPAQKTEVQKQAEAAQIKRPPALLASGRCINLLQVTDIVPQLQLERGARSSRPHNEKRTRRFENRVG